MRTTVPPRNLDPEEPTGYTSRLFLDRRPFLLDDNTLLRLRRQLQRQQRRVQQLRKTEALVRDLFGSWGTCRFLALAAGGMIALWATGQASSLILTYGKPGGSDLTMNTGLLLLGVLLVFSLGAAAGVRAYSHWERKRSNLTPASGKTVPADWVASAQRAAAERLDRDQAELAALEEQARLERNTGAAPNLRSRPSGQRL